MEQGSPEWITARVGKVTASRVADVIARTKSGYATSRANYMTELAIEQIVGLPAEQFVSEDMLKGSEREPFARAAFTFEEGYSVEEVGFIEHPFIPMSGASPDGYVGSEELLEIKCPKVATHIDTLLSEAVPAKHMPQITWQAACTRRMSCHYVSFHPDLPIDLRYFHQLVVIHPNAVAELEAEVEKFIRELAALVDKLRARIALRRAA